ncbi:type I 3-dehydroquinate dehydratase [Propionibacterium freudenreichii]|uniref:type I 3-dehydroquinate dehydratase n=1 Tax=Propionibacterium freudenreichii TaxID=1744 RepID=UPI000543A98B|nr:type I 3-dehydroquinate dehydratase [Propionibacterium freudenreichii]CEG94557.1 3-dehydroquinate dehydratase [Propionibacterium freudenreichii]
MAVLELAGLTLGGPHTAIIVPLTGADPGAVQAQAEVASQPAVDLVEWRVDAFAPGADDALLADTARHIRTTTGKPLLATVRTGSEGGHFTGSPEDYARLVATLAGLDDVDAVDVEYRHPAAPETIASAHRASTAVIGSFHDFAGTPSLDAMVAHLEAMEQAGAQLCKLAVMPHNPEDTARLLLATATRSRDAHTPLLTIAMRRLGLASRLCGRDFGSCASFAALDEHGSAPGQLPLDDLAQALSIVRHAER